MGWRCNEGRMLVWVCDLVMSWRLSGLKMLCFGSNIVWFCYVFFLDESEYFVEIWVSM